MSHSLVFDRVTFAYRDGFALAETAFTAERGQIIGLLGKNGAGKTTIIHLLLGFLKPTSGAVTLAGLAPAAALAARKIGYVPDTPHLAPELTVRETLKLHGYAAGMTEDGIQSAISRYAEQFELSAHLRKRVGRLSKGMGQKVALIIGFMHEPELVILDEPTSGYDPEAQIHFRDFLRDQAAAGRTIFFSSHSLSEIEKVCSRFLFIKAGKLQADLAPDAIETLEGAFLQYCT